MSASTRERTSAGNEEVTNEDPEETAPRARWARAAVACLRAGPTHPRAVPDPHVCPRPDGHAAAHRGWTLPGRVAARPRAGTLPLDPTTAVHHVRPLWGLLRPPHTGGHCAGLDSPALLPHHAPPQSVGLRPLAGNEDCLGAWPKRPFLPRRAGADHQSYDRPSGMVGPGWAARSTLLSDGPDARARPDHAHGRAGCLPRNVWDGLGRMGVLCVSPASRLLYAASELVWRRVAQLVRRRALSAVPAYERRPRPSGVACSHWHSP